MQIIITRLLIIGWFIAAATEAIFSFFLFGFLKGLFSLIFNFLIIGLVYKYLSKEFGKDKDDKALNAVAIIAYIFMWIALLFVLSFNVVWSYCDSSLNSYQYFDKQVNVPILARF